MKNFDEFSNKVLTPKKLEQLKRKSTAVMMGAPNFESQLTAFSATFCMNMLELYHEWLQKEED